MKNIFTSSIPSTGDQDDNQISEHTDHLFCYDMTCPCHESKYLVEELGELVDEGLASTDDANRIFRGRNV